MASRSGVASRSEEQSSRRRERMRAILVEAGLRLFAKQGVDATTIDEIVNVAGVAKGTFYNYFTDRADIARAVAATVRHSMNAAVEEINRGIGDPAERISRGVRLFMAGVVLDPVKAAMLARLYESGASLDAHGNAHLLSDIRDGIAKGRIKVPGELAALHLVVAVGTIGIRHVLDTIEAGGEGTEILRGEGYARQMAAVLLAGLGLAHDEVEEILARPFDASGIKLFG
ncbi:MAG: TetR/AcrR family transcriptional regulator [Alphaproteobacteria bacterium]|nr:TetR/AcrR family transcriptional regulator [Alphaproteobacteria bacterium]MDX5415750.1 TetR/AcrR family transcriptional regulator [Alphaproteobacteria bacterium]MDX5493017.1 TetR/AcrR family transcriptional regulator [Alphaproteobacteria bacterium]